MALDTMAGLEEKRRVGEQQEVSTVMQMAKIDPKGAANAWNRGYLGVKFGPIKYVGSKGSWRGYADGNGKLWTLNLDTGQWGESVGKGKPSDGMSELKIQQLADKEFFEIQRLVQERGRDASDVIAADKWLAASVHSDGRIIWSRVKKLLLDKYRQLGAGSAAPGRMTLERPGQVPVSPETPGLLERAEEGGKKVLQTGQKAASKFGMLVRDVLGPRGR